MGPRLSGRWPWAVEAAIKQYGMYTFINYTHSTDDDFIGDVVRIAPNELVFGNPQAATGKF